MKHFVYLDTDLINSYLAQIHGGLVDVISTEKQSEQSSTLSQTKAPSINGSKFTIGISKFLGYEYSHTSNYLEEITTISQTEAGKEILSKIIHDNSYDSLIEYLTNNNRIRNYDNNSSLEVGEYLILYGKFRMVDLSMISKLFNEDFKSIYSFISDRQLENIAQTLNREQRRSKELKNVQTNMQKKTESLLKDMKAVVNFISQILPSDKYIIYDNIFIPLKGKYLREDYASIRYKYSTNSYIAGQITGDIKSIMNFTPKNELDEALKALDQITLELFKSLSISENFWIMDPIAWYFV